LSPNTREVHERRVSGRGPFSDEVSGVRAESYGVEWSEHPRGKLFRYPVSQVNDPSPAAIVRFGVFQLDEQAGLLFKNGRIVRLKPQPFKLLLLLVNRAGEVVTREEIREELWGSDTFVDFEQGVNSAIKQVREALGEDADRSLYVETVPKRGYRFTAPVEGRNPHLPPPRTDLALHKAMWLNIAELRLAEEHRLKRKQQLKTVLVIGAVVTVLTIAVVAVFLARG
jgi:DNA-binding winged helix-turn-helix (wHTH) protein